jgi:hypothetical protein
MFLQSYSGSITLHASYSTVDLNLLPVAHMWPATAFCAAHIYIL